MKRKRVNGVNCNFDDPSECPICDAKLQLKEGEGEYYLICRKCDYIETIKEENNVLTEVLRMNEEKVFKAFDLGAIEKRSRSKVSPRVPVNIRVSEAASKWLKEKGYSPTGLFNESMRMLGFVEPDAVVSVEVKGSEREGMSAGALNLASKVASVEPASVEATPEAVEEVKGPDEPVEDEEPHPQSYEANNAKSKEGGQ